MQEHWLDFNKLYLQLQETVTTYGLQVILALATLVLGLWLAKRLQRGLLGVMRKAKVDTTLVSFLGNMLHIGLMVLVVVIALTQLGVETTSIIAVLGAASLAVALSLQGSLSNLAAGVIILFMRPFRIGDLIDAGGTSGTVKDINILLTQLLTVDGKVVYVPNGQMTSAKIINMSRNPTRRVDVAVGIGYDDDIKKARQAILDEIAKDPRCLQDPKPQVLVVGLGDNSVDLSVRVWTKRQDWWATSCDLNEAVKLRLDAEGVNIPYPQRDVHLFYRNHPEDAPRLKAVEN